MFIENTLLFVFKNQNNIVSLYQQKKDNNNLKHTIMRLNKDVKNLQSRISYKVRKAATPRQIHFDNIAIEMGYADSNIAFKQLGKVFIAKAKINAPSILL